MTTAIKTIRTGDRKYTTNFTYENRLRVKVTTSHNKERKEFRTYVSVVWFEQNGNFVIEKSIGSIFGDLFARTIAVTPCNRYSEKNFELAIAEGLAKFNEVALEYEVRVGSLLHEGETE
jgi:hypothetical protein